MVNLVPVSGRRLWLCLFALGLCIAMAWGLASPRLNGPDERDHAIRAVGTVRGHLIGDFELGARGYRMNVPVPHQACAPLLDDQIDCRPSTAPGEANILTGEFRHPPPYYAIVGLPTLVSLGVNVGYAMRLVSALIGAALLAWALQSAIESGRRIHVLGVVAATTPIVWFLVATVNPNGLEIAAAICLWSSCFAAATQARLTNGVVFRCGISLTVLVMSRGISPVYGLMALAAAGVMASAERRSEIVGRRDVRRWLVIAAAGTAVTGAWVAVAGFSHNVHRDGQDATEVLRLSGLYLQQSVGDWLDLNVSLPYAVAMYALVVVPLIAMGIAKSRPRDRTVVLTLLAIALVLPLTSDILNLPPIASAWQGRYGLPMVTGVVIVAAYACQTEVGTRLWQAVLGALAVTEIAAFTVFARHWDLSRGRTLGVILFNAAAVIAFAVVLDRSVTDPRARVAERT